MNLKNTDTRLIVLLLFFGLIFSSISLVNHYNFRTSAWDLGINNNAIYDYAHFRWNDCMLLQPQFSNLLSDHFSLVIIPISFFYFFTGSYTLLLFQILMILFGAVGIYKYFQLKSPQNDIPIHATFHFLTIWGIYSALSFDYHDNVTGAMLVPWFLYYFEQQKKIAFALFFALILVSKENVALWCAFICLGLTILHWRDKQRFTGALALTLIAGSYFLVVVNWVMPSLANEGREYLHFKYMALGNNFGEMMVNIFKNPLLPLKMMFINHTGLPEADGIKLELHIYVLLSGGFLLLLRPQYLVMLIPVFAQKLFNDDYGKWGLNYQYSIEFVPILTIGAFSVISTLPTGIKNIAVWFVPALSLFMTMKSLDSRESIPYRGENHRFYSVKHYQRDFDIKKVYKAIDKIPANARLSAQAPIVPHVSFRDYIYQFPVVQDAEFILVNTADETYPLTLNEFHFEIKNLLYSDKWILFYRDDPVMIFKKKS